MHLVASVDQEFEIDGTKFTILKDEAIHTENSYKYTSEDFETTAVNSGFDVEKCWSDPDDLFSIQYLKAVQSHFRRPFASLTQLIGLVC